MNAKDHFTELPSELIHIICNCIFPTHMTDLAFQTQRASFKIPRHPLRQLTATCKRMRLEVNAWCLHSLKEHAAITGYKELKTAKLQQKRSFTRELLQWTATHCVFCGKKSQRTAILMNGFHCCAACDKAQWPDKITKTAAKAEFDLKDNRLVPHPLLADKLPKGIPRVRYGTYVTSNVVTTMFLRHELRGLARFVHGDVDEHMRKRGIAKEEWLEKRRAIENLRKGK